MSRQRYEPLPLDPRASGSFKIVETVRPPGTTLETSNMRTSLLGGQPREVITYPEERAWHQLCDEDGVWMSDYPIEQAQHEASLVDVEGSVLVGGLGIGLAVAILAPREDVTEILVIEKSADVISLVEQSFSPIAREKTTVICADLLQWHGVCRYYFDVGFFDLWRGDGEGVFHEMVAPLRRDYARHCDEILCWNEDVMRGQFALGLRSRLAGITGPEEHRWPGLTIELLTTEQGSTYFDWQVPFWTALADRLDEDPEVLNGLAGIYAGCYAAIPDWRLYWAAQLEEEIG